ncbi:uncharacterized protein LOC118201984 [Stegodyphus dumicola]|uniref:uncharacterized protein LOC118201984 n=1 Tax=Stegodyphus dumicola TaxID=202533 RepID=UPI0015A81E51|nr:uncharacterized protein LOC118201984 [Stegodyphus dumicola]
MYNAWISERILGLPLVLQNDDLQGQFPFNPLFFVFSAIYFAFHTIASFAVVPAVKEGNEMFIVPTIVMLLVDIVLDCTAIIVMVMKLVKQSPLENILIGGITIGVLFLPLLMYSTLIVISQFEELFNRPDKIPLQKRKSSKSLLCAQSMDSSGSSETSTGTLV